jgi:uncharacterized protein YlxW (UPF0749 family)
MDQDNAPQQEFAGNYPESELVEDLLSQGEEWNYLKFQMAQNAITDQRWAANASQAFATMVIGKAAEAFPKARSLELVSEAEQISKTLNDDTSTTTQRETLETMADKMSKTVDAFKTAVDDLQTQMTDVIATLARIEVEGS